MGLYTLAEALRATLTFLVLLPLSVLGVYALIRYGRRRDRRRHGCHHHHHRCCCR